MIYATYHRVRFSMKHTGSLLSDRPGIGNPVSGFAPPFSRFVPIFGSPNPHILLLWTLLTE